MSEEQKTEIAPANQGRAILKVLLLLVVLAHGALLIRHAWLTLAHPWPLTYTEGVVLNHAQRSIEGQALYANIESAPPWIHNPYSPGFYWLAKMFHRFAPEGYLFSATRLMTLFALSLCCLWIFLIVKKRAGPGVAGCSVALFLFSPITLRYSAWVRPDFTALVFALAAIWLGERSEKARGFLITGIVAGCAIMIKPVYGVALLAVAARILSNKATRKQILFLFIGAIVSALPLLLLLKQHFLQHMLMNRLPFEAGHALAFLIEYSSKHALLFAALLAYLFRSKNQRTAAWWYALFAPLGLLLIFKIGAEENYFIETIATAAIAAGLLAANLKEKSVSLLLACVIAQLALYAPIKPAPTFTRTYGQEISNINTSPTPTKTDREVGELILAEISTTSGTILCEDPGYLLVAGRDIVFQPYQFSQLHAAGKWDQKPIVEMLRHRQFALVITTVNLKTEKSAYLTQAMQQAILNLYSQKRIIGKFFIYEAEISMQENANKL